MPPDRLAPGTGLSVSDRQVVHGGEYIEEEYTLESGEAIVARNDGTDNPGDYGV
jgi:ABC-type hemin transport system substrate-binding protein